MELGEMLRGKSRLRSKNAVDWCLWRRYLKYRLDSRPQRPGLEDEGAFASASNWYISAQR